jgi:hypothetical protein
MAFVLAERKHIARLSSKSVLPVSPAVGIIEYGRRTSIWEK